MSQLKQFNLPARRALGRLVLEWSALLLMLCSAVWWLSDSSWASKANYYFYDCALSAHQRIADSRIVLIQVDERSIAELGRWPWNRRTHAKLLAQIERHAPHSVLFDVLFTESSQDSRDDAALAQSMRSLPTLAVPILMEDNLQGHLESILPVEPIASSAKLGHIAILPDSDGVVRRVSLQQVDSTGKQWPLLTTLLLNSDFPLVSETPNVDSTGSKTTFRIPFAVSQGNYVSFSYTDVLNNRIPADILKDKFILIGATAAGLSDQYPTPISMHNSTMPGVEIHANILDGLLNHQRISMIGSPFLRGLFAITPVVLFLTLLLFLRERFHLFAFLTFSVLYLSVILALLWYFQLWFKPIVSLAGISLAYLLWSWRRLSVFQNHLNFELQQLSFHTGHLFRHLPNLVSIPSYFFPHTLELNIERVHRLGHFVTDSLQNLPFAVILFDNSGRIMLHNSLAAQVFKSDINNQDVLELLASLDVSKPEWLRKFKNQWLLLDKYELMSHSGQVFVLHIIPFTLSSSRLTNPNSSSTLWQISLVDLTNERAAQKQRNDLMTFMSHDLRSPQVGILSLIRLFQDTSNPITAHELIVKITEKVYETLNSAGDLLMLAQAQDKAHYVMDDVNLSMLISLASEQVWAQATAKGIKIEAENINGRFDSLWMMGDGAMLTRALVNLLNNAIRYSSDNTRISIEATRENQIIKCVISDYGQGIDSIKLESLNRTTQHLSLISPSRPDAAGSFGIGLKMVKAVVLQHGGTLEFISAVGSGTSVIVYLPAINDELVADELK